MALVLVQEIRDLAAVLFHSIDDLLGLADGHAGVVLAVDDHEWGCNFPGLVDGAYVLEELTVLLQRAVLGLSQGATIGARVLQEGNEVGDPHDIHPRAPEFRVFGESGEHHEPAVGASHYRDTLVAALPQPVRRVCQVLDGVHPQSYVVEVGVSLAVSRRSTDVREEHGVAPAEQILRHGGESGTRLALGPAVDVHYYGCVLCLGLVEEGRYPAIVEAGIAHDPRLAEAAGRDACRRGAGETLRISVGQVDDPDVRVALRGREGEGESS